MTPGGILSLFGLAFVAALIKDLVMAWLVILIFPPLADKFWFIFLLLLIYTLHIKFDKKVD